MVDGAKMNTSHLVEADTSAKGPADAKLRPWLDNLTKPWWLLNDIYADFWIIKDKSQAKPITIRWAKLIFIPDENSVSLLTDPENSHLLEIVQLYCFFLREDESSHITHANSQRSLTLILINIIIWMRLNHIYRFSQIRRTDLKNFAQKAPWGWPELHEVFPRLERYVAHLKANEQTPPVLLKKKSEHSIKEYTYVNLEIISHCIGYNVSKVGTPKWTHRFWTHMQSFGINPPSNRAKEKRELLKGDEPQSEPIKADTLKIYFQAWTHLYNLRHRLSSDPLQIDPTMGRDTLSYAKKVLKDANALRAEGRTETIPDLQAVFLIDRSIRWVLDYADDLLDLRDECSNCYENARTSPATKENKQPEAVARKNFNKFFSDFSPKEFSADDPAAPWPLDPHLKKNRYSKNLTLGQAVNSFLPIACAIVIATFTARRDEEIMTVRDNLPNDTDSSPPAIEIDGEGNPWIWCWIEKTIQGWDRTPCPRIVVKAVEVLTKLSRSARELGTDRRLFLVRSLSMEREMSEVRFGSGLLDFAEFIGVPPLKDGTHWRFTPHQLRKFFSLVYMWRYEHGNFSALKDHLYQFNEATTERYVFEIKETETLKEVRKAHSTSLIIDIISGDRAADGSAGTRISQDLIKITKQALKNTEIISTSQKNDVILRIATRFVERTGLKMIPFYWGYCVALENLTSGEFQGHCVKPEKTANGPNFAHATPETCLGCGHFYIDDKFRHYWETQEEAWRTHSKKDNIVGAAKNKALNWAEVFRRGVEKHFGQPRC